MGQKRSIKRNKKLNWTERKWKKGANSKGKGWEESVAYLHEEKSLRSVIEALPFCETGEQRKTNPKQAERERETAKE